MPSTIFFVRLPTQTKLLLRLRAARAGISMSAFARDLLNQALGAPSPTETAFLTASSPQMDCSLLIAYRRPPESSGSRP